MSPRKHISRPRRLQRRGPSLKLRIYALLALAACVLLGWAALARQLMPLSNTDRTHFDAIIVLGTPADSDGNPTPTQLERVEEGVREYRHGIAPHILFTGGAAHNRFIEATVMADAARAKGVPNSAILQETQAMDTIQNACYSAQILKQHGWHSAEVVSNASHLPRAAMIFSHLPLNLQLEWRMHPTEPDSAAEAIAFNFAEALKTARYLIWARWAESCQN